MLPVDIEETRNASSRAALWRSERGPRLGTQKELLYYRPVPGPVGSASVDWFAREFYQIDDILSGSGESIC